jgi:hypothetical protein
MPYAPRDAVDFFADAGVLAVAPAESTTGRA